MNMPPLSELVVGLLLLASGAVVLLAALGLWRLPDFFARMHAPALVSTLAAWVVTLASIVHFTARGEGLDLRVWLVLIGLAITAPITSIVLARAGLFRRRRAGDALPPPLAATPQPSPTSTPTSTPTPKPTTRPAPAPDPEPKPASAETQGAAAKRNEGAGPGGC